MTDGVRGDDRAAVRSATWQVIRVLHLVALILTVAFVVRDLLGLLVVAVFLTAALEPAVRFLTAHRWRRPVAVGAVLAASALVGAAFLVALRPVLEAQLHRVAAAIPGAAQLREIITGPRSVLAWDILGWDEPSVNLAVAAGLTALFTWLLLTGVPDLQRAAFRSLPERRRTRARQAWEAALHATGGYMYSRLLLATLACAVAAPALSLLQAPHAVTLAAWYAVCGQFVPLVGVALAVAPPVLLAAALAGPAVGTGTAAVLIGYRVLENLLLAPRTVRRSFPLHPAAAIGAILVGGALLGWLGAALTLSMTALVLAYRSDMRRTPLPQYPQTTPTAKERDQ